MFVSLAHGDTLPLPRQYQSTEGRVSKMPACCPRREDLFDNAVVCGLVDKGDILVARRKGGCEGKSVREKHVGSG